LKNLNFKAFFAVSTKTSMRLFFMKEMCWTCKQPANLRSSCYAYCCWWF